MRALIFIACLAFLAVPAFAQGDTPVAPTVEEVYLARDNGDGKAGEQVNEFRTNDVPIYCVVLLDAVGKVTVKMNFVAVNVSGVKPETKVVTASYTTKDGQNRVNFTGRPEGKWTPGKYRVDLFIDGKAAKNLEFEIKGAGAVNSAVSGFQPTPPQQAKPKSPKRPN